MHSLLEFGASKWNGLSFEESSITCLFNELDKNEDFKIEPVEIDESLDGLEALASIMICMI